MTRRGIAVLGSTGSIGTTTLRVLDRHSDRFRVAALTAHSNAALLGKQQARFDPGYVGLVNSGESSRPGWFGGTECLIEAATRDDVDIVLNAIVGTAGLDATLAALRAGKRVALANKETLVMAGALAAEACAEGGGEIIPVDSEHSAILQCIGSRPASEVRRVILTASGGPFRGWSAAQLVKARLEDALQHPTWAMGRKITIDSATLANKALEVIEAHFLFGLPYDCIDVVVHPQSIVHSFVEFVDGSVVAQMSLPSMELPVLYALTHPERASDDAAMPFDPVAVSPMTFEPVAHDQFPALRMGVEAGRRGGSAPAVYNAANEQAVALFLDGRILFGDIPRAIESALDSV
ncbi:MAG: 1-deoxy-D-xylulose-5-phosphate reductoisomerase, partial [Gemmatimonadaceae bacterium]